MNPANRFHMEKKAALTTAAIIRLGDAATTISPNMVQ